MTIRPQPLMRTLAAAVLSLVIGAPAAMADAPVTLTMYNGQHKEIGEASPRPTRPRPVFTSTFARAAATSWPARSSKKATGRRPTSSTPKSPRP